MSITHSRKPRPTPLEGIDLNLLVALEALLAEGSVTAAAHRCRVTQSAMSHSLAKLRTLLGDELLVRTQHGMTPTPRARALGPALTRALAELRSVVASGSVFDPATARRSFTICTSDFGALVVVPQLMDRLQREAPGVEILLRPLTNDYLELLEDERLDLVFTPYPEPRATMSAQKLFDERFVCLLRPGHPAVKRGQRTLDLDTYAALAHIQVAPRAVRGGPIDDTLAKAGRARHVALRVHDFLVAPFVVATTDLALTLPERIARIFEASHGLRVFEPPFPSPGFGVWQMWHERRRDDPAHTWLRNAVVSAQPRGRARASAARV